MKQLGWCAFMHGVLDTRKVYAFFEVKKLSQKLNGQKFESLVVVVVVFVFLTVRALVSAQHYNLLLCCA